MASEAADDAVRIGARLALAALARAEESTQQRERALAARSSTWTIELQTTAPTGTLQAIRRETAGYLVALGDSWFDYFFHDVLERLHALGFDIEHAAHKGDRVEDMAYNGGQIDKLAHVVDKVLDAGGCPKAVLISGGGNDIVADDLGLLLNSALSPQAGWNGEILDALLKRMHISYCTLIGAVNQICVDKLGDVVPVVVHGYDYPVPDGRGILFGPFPGPWLKPGFKEKHFDDVPTNRILMRDVIDGINDTLQVLATAGPFANVYHLDLRGTLSSELAGDAYQDDWANELHPTKQGFTLVAEQFANLVDTLPDPICIRGGQ